jgi:hypothetical protein
MVLIQVRKKLLMGKDKSVVSPKACIFHLIQITNVIIHLIYNNLQSYTKPILRTHLIEYSEDGLVGGGNLIIYAKAAPVLRAF